MEQVVFLFFLYHNSWCMCSLKIVGQHVSWKLKDLIRLTVCLLYCHYCSRAAQSRTQAIRELPLLPLTSLTRFADNTHTFLFFLLFLCLSVSLSFLSFPLSVPFFCICVCEKNPKPVKLNFTLCVSHYTYMDIPMSYPKEPYMLMCVCDYIWSDAQFPLCVCARHRS